MLNPLGSRFAVWTMSLPKMIYLTGTFHLVSTPSLLVTLPHITSQLNDDHIGGPSIQSLARRWHVIE